MLNDFVLPPPVQHLLEIATELLHFQLLGDGAADCPFTRVDHARGRGVIADPEHLFEIGVLDPGVANLRRPRRVERLCRGGVDWTPPERRSDCR